MKNDNLKIKQVFLDEEENISLPKESLKLDLYDETTGDRNGRYCRVNHSFGTIEAFADGQEETDAVTMLKFSFHIGGVGAIDCPEEKPLFRCASNAKSADKNSVCIAFHGEFERHCFMQAMKQACAIMAGEI